MNYGSSKPRRLAAVPESVELDSSAPSLHLQSSYRDSIRSVSIVPSSSARFYPRNDGDAERENGNGSSASSGSSHPTSSSGSGYGSGLSSTDGTAGFNGAHELRAIALRMVNDGYIRGIIRAFGDQSGSSVEAHAGGPDHERLIVERWFSELDVEWLESGNAMSRGIKNIHKDHMLQPHTQRLITVNEVDRWRVVKKVQDVNFDSLPATSTSEQNPLESPSISMVEEGTERRTGERTTERKREPHLVSALHTGQGGDSVQLPLDLESLRDLMERWIRALLTMVHVLFITQMELRFKKTPVVPVGGVMKAIQYIPMLVGMATPAGAGAGATGETASSDHGEEAILFARFAEVSVLRMLAFVDAVSDAAQKYHWAPEALPGMLQVYACIADASPTVLGVFKGVACSTAVFEGMNAAFLRKRTKLSNTIWSMMDMVRASFFTDDHRRCQISLELSGSGVHETTRLMMNYVELLWSNQDALKFVLQDHHFSVFVSDDEGFNLVVNLIVDVISCLEEHLVDTTRSIEDHGLRYIFLMNNCDFISQQVASLYPVLPSWFPLDGSKVQRYIDAYLHASWTPVLSCLGRPRYASLPKFESKFHTIWNSHRLWKVPDPELRKRLRKAIVDKVIPWYTGYLEQLPAMGKRTTTPSSTPHELQEVLEELFEG